ncbi:DUF934 domain-containing protein [Parahaliea aestuarii]|uniref:DUF934 domain-containing protein n=1 Tax=Parahaliea aestuarii TaxID=1852021 RepID=A0A5C8ZUA4_9GAMM|nr:DUF934 domain-containing protein [Parahaliea aestuarii]TXS91142.1 DUF934 domain-containing protein [Parahaliea aestuarii]
MPKLIKNGEVVNDERWQAVDTEADNAAPGVIATLSQWQALDDKAGSAVQLEPGDGVETLLPHLADIELIAISFPVFTDGRGFSYARELRQRGYTGELRAVGGFIRDQLHYLSRVGFNAFQMNDDRELEEAVASLGDFSEHYQAAVDQPLPLFRRRA